MEGSRHAGFKAAVVRLIAKRPCLSFASTLLFASLIGALGFVFGGMSIDTEGWETRGTPLANRAIQHEVWRQGNFDISHVGVPAAWGSEDDEYDRRRRRARSLLYARDAFETDDDDDDAHHASSGFSRRRNLLASSSRPTRVGSARALLAASSPRACAEAYEPTIVSDVDSASEETIADADRATNARHDGASLGVIFYSRSGGDLWTRENLAATCEAEDAILAAGGYATMCARSRVECAAPAPDASLAPGLAATYLPSDESAAASSFSRCLPPASYARHFMARLDLRSCDAFRTDARVPGFVEAFRASMVRCAALHRSGGEEEWCDPRETGFDASALNAGFGTDASGDAVTTTAALFALDGGAYDRVIEWLAGVYGSGGLDVGRGDVAVAYDTVDGGLKEAIVDEALGSDMLLSVVAVLIIAALMWAHTGSAFLTLAGLLQVSLSFPSAVFLVTMAYRVTFFPFLNFIGVFVIAGIGADDCFVMFDKWAQAAARAPPGADALRVADACYWEATWAMFLTSLTTAAAFLSSAVIPIAPIRVFSLFMSAMVAFDYLYDVTVFASCVAFQHDLLRREDASGWVVAACDLRRFLRRRREKARTNGGGTGGDSRKYENDAKEIPGEGSESEVGSSVRRSSSSPPSTPRPAWRDAAGETKRADGSRIVRVVGEKKDATSLREEEEEDHVPGSERFFRDVAYPALHRFRVPLVILMLASGAAAGYGASTLTTPRDNDVLLLGEASPLERYAKFVRTGFLDSSEGSLTVSAVWGARARDDGDHFDPSARPNLALDAEFDPTSEAAQVWLRDFCVTTARLKSPNGWWDCPLSRWADWVEANEKVRANYTASGLGSVDAWLNAYPTFEGEEIAADAAGDAVRPDAFERACGARGFPVAAETMARCAFLWAGDSRRERKMFAFPRRDSQGYSEDDDEEEVMIFFARARFSSNISWTSPLPELEADHARWEAYVAARVAEAPEGLRGGFQTAEAWWWMDTVARMERGAYSAAGLTLILAAAVIFCGTANALVTLYSVVAIFCILAATVACVVAMGWTLGFLEGVCFSILIGLSVDFVIHVGQAYVEAAERGARERGRPPGREHCAERAIATMGFPVVSAGVTTFCSAIVLFFCQITFFNKFGTIVALSMAFALAVTFAMYLPMLDLAGPVGDVGDAGALVGRGMVWRARGKGREERGGGGDAEEAA